MANLFVSTPSGVRSRRSARTFPLSLCIALLRISEATYLGRHCPPAASGLLLRVSEEEGSEQCPAGYYRLAENPSDANLQKLIAFSRGS